MSFKTLRKRIALVAVAALAVTGLSTVPANAAGEELTGNSAVTAITASSVTTAPTTGTAVFVKFGASLAALTAAAGNSADVITFRCIVSNYPAGGSVSIAANTAANATPAGTNTPVVKTAGTAANPTTLAVSDDALTLTLPAENDTAWNAQTLTYIGGCNFTPTKAGVHEVTVWRDLDRDAIVDANEVRQSVSITVVAAAGYSNTLSTAYMSVDAAADGTVDAPTATTDAGQAFVTAAKGGRDGSNDNAASINLVIKDSANANYASGASMSAEISGPGYLRWANEAVAGDKCATTPSFGADLGRSLAARAVDAQSALYVCADGTAGVATITIKITDAADVVHTLAVKKITFYGAVAKIVATPVLTVARAGGITATGDAAADRNLATEIPSVIVKATDKDGNPVSRLTITAKSSDTTVMSDAITVNEDVLSTANIYSSGGKGFYNISVTGSTASVSGKKATLTFRVVDPAGDGTTFLTSTVDYTIGGSVATETLSFDKASYAPGEAMVVTRTAKDSAGNPVYDGAASPAITFSKAVGGTAPAAGIYVGGKSASSTSVATASVFAPVVSGGFNAIATSGATGSPTITASSAVASPIDATIASLVAAIAKLQKAINKIQKRLNR